MTRENAPSGKPPVSGRDYSNDRGALCWHARGYWRWWHVSVHVHNGTTDWSWQRL